MKLRHANVVRLRGFYYSRGRGECFLVYDFAPSGNLLQFLNAKDGKHLDWFARVRIAHGIAKGKFPNLFFKGFLFSFLYFVNINVVATLNKNVGY